MLTPVPLMWPVYTLRDWIPSSKKLVKKSTETIIAGKAGDEKQIVYEMADLWFHSLVLLAHKGLKAEQVLQELERRFGLSGHEEKASRSPSDSANK